MISELINIREKLDRAQTELDHARGIKADAKAAVEAARQEVYQLQDRVINLKHIEEKLCSYLT